MVEWKGGKRRLSSIVESLAVSWHHDMYSMLGDSGGGGGGWRLGRMKDGGWVLGIDDAAV
jgi:hypothetical protein